MVLDHKSRLTVGASQEIKKPDVVVYSQSQIMIKFEYFPHDHTLDTGTNAIMLQLELNIPLLSRKKGSSFVTTTALESHHLTEWYLC